MVNTDTRPNSFDFDELVGEEFDFYGIDDTCFKLDETIYEAVESNDRLEEVRVCPDKYHHFHQLPIARVVIERGVFTDEVYELIDLHDGHTWLCFGTEVHYERACELLFTFEYTPKAPIE